MKDAQHSPNPREQREKQRALALSALTQASFLIANIAQEGKCKQQYFEHCIDALLDDDYIGNRHFSLGNTQIKRLLQGHEINYTKHIMSYTAGMLAVEKKLSKQADKLHVIGKGMARVHQQIKYFNNPYHDNIIAALAHLYGETISTIEPRIIIRGKPEHLKQTKHTEQIRCLLFSGIRAAWVWRTHGGNSLRLLVGRKKLIHNLNQLSNHKPS